MILNTIYNILLYTFFLFIVQFLPPKFRIQENKTRVCLLHYYIPSLQNAKSLVCSRNSVRNCRMDEHHVLKPYVNSYPHPLLERLSQTNSNVISQNQTMCGIYCGIFYQHSCFEAILYSCLLSLPFLSSTSVPKQNLLFSYASCHISLLTMYSACLHYYIIFTYVSTIQFL